MAADTMATTAGTADTTLVAMLVGITEDSTGIGPVKEPLWHRRRGSFGYYRRSRTIWQQLIFPLFSAYNI